MKMIRKRDSIEVIEHNGENVEEVVNWCYENGIGEQIRVIDKLAYIVRYGESYFINKGYLVIKNGNLTYSTKELLFNEYELFEEENEC